MNGIDGSSYMSPENQQQIQRRINAFLNEIKEFVPNAAVLVNSGAEGSPLWFTLEVLSGDALSLRQQAMDWVNVSSHLALQSRLQPRPPV